MSTSSDRWFALYRSGDAVWSVDAVWRVLCSDRTGQTADHGDYNIDFVNALPPGTMVLSHHFIYVDCMVLTSHGELVAVGDCVEVKPLAVEVRGKPIKHFTLNGTHLFVHETRIVGLKFTKSDENLVDEDETWFGNLMKKHLTGSSVVRNFKYLLRSDLMGDTEKEKKLESCKTLDEFVTVSRELEKWSVEEKKNLQYIAEKQNQIARMTQARIDRANDDKARLAFEKIAEAALQTQLAKRRKLE